MYKLHLRAEQTLHIAGQGTCGADAHIVGAHEFVDLTESTCLRQDTVFLRHRVPFIHDGIPVLLGRFDLAGVSGFITAFGKFFTDGFK